MRQYLLFLFAWLLALQLHAQPYSPNTTYFGANSYIEYFSGTLPVILAAPHGGALTPASIPDRSCTGCVTVTDSYTQNLSREIDSALFNRFGCHPHFIINRLKRTKLDANREIVEAAQGNPDAEQAWYDFHNFIQAAKDSIVTHYGAGVFLDMHGHEHSVQRLELGYLVSKSELQLSDSLLNLGNYGDNSSIRNLILANPNGFDFTALLRGPEAFGTYNETAGFPAVPSQPDPFPMSGESYFSGGYNTARHGSKNGGSIDAIQIECNQDVRFVEADRQEFADSLAGVILQFLETHYFSDSILGGCAGQISGREDLRLSDLQIFPNPSAGNFQVHCSNGVLREAEISLLNSMGATVAKTDDFEILTPNSIQLKTQNLAPGVYWLKVVHPLGFTTKKAWIRE